MSMPPLITIVIPCYNQGNYILEALQSIRASTYQSLEVLVIDDGSTYASAPTQYLHLPFHNLRFIFQPNRGVSHTRNRGMKEAHGEFIFFLDADDLLAPHYLKHAITRFLIHPELALVAANYRQFRDGETPGDLVMTWQHFNHTEFLDKGGVLISSLFRKELGLRCGGFSNFLNRLAGEDYEFWLSITNLILTLTFFQKPVSSIDNTLDHVTHNTKNALSHASSVYSNIIDYFSSTHSSRCAFHCVCYGSLVCN